MNICFTYYIQEIYIYIHTCNKDQVKDQDQDV